MSSTLLCTTEFALAILRFFLESGGSRGHPMLAGRFARRVAAMFRDGWGLASTPCPAPSLVRQGIEINPTGNFGLDPPVGLQPSTVSEVRGPNVQGRYEDGWLCQFAGETMSFTVWIGEIEATVTFVVDIERWRKYFEAGLTPLQAIEQYRIDDEV